jgi:hypothetical protein
VPKGRDFHHCNTAHGRFRVNGCRSDYVGTTSDNPRLLRTCRVVELVSLGPEGDQNHPSIILRFQSPHSHNLPTMASHNQQGRGRCENEACQFLTDTACPDAASLPMPPVAQSVLKSYCSLGLGFLAVTISTHVDAGVVSRRERERFEVRAIFSMLLSRIDPGDAVTRHDLPCVMPEKWSDFVPDDGHIRPHVLLTPRQALDPKGEHPQMFCDLAERNAQAKEIAKGLSGDDSVHVTTADMSFSYPIFNRSLTRATLQHEGANTLSKAVRQLLLVPGASFA